MTTDEKIKVVISHKKELDRLRPLLRSQLRINAEFGNEGMSTIMVNIQKQINRIEKELTFLLPDDIKAPEILDITRIHDNG